MMATGLWQDTVYSACCFMGARCKAQRLRHNIDEIAQWPALHCHHTHAADEWQPYLQDGQRVFPSKEEAEYTASLAFGIAVSASWWAARVGPFGNWEAMAVVASSHIDDPRWQGLVFQDDIHHACPMRCPCPLFQVSWAQPQSDSCRCHCPLPEGPGINLQSMFRLPAVSTKGKRGTWSFARALRLFPATIATRPLGFHSMWSTSCSTWR